MKYQQILDALSGNYPGAEYTWRGNDYNDLVWISPGEKPSLVELQAAEPIRLLRVERNQKLAETDWWAGKDLTMSQARKDYRQALRDLPASANPTLDENGQLTNITWPTKPE